MCRYGILLAVLIGTASGSWTDTTFVPPSLGFANPMAVFLPEGYQPGGTLDYQVLIWLHGWGNHYCADTLLLRMAHDQLVAQGKIAPSIMVCPEGYCPPYDGSMWANSELYGDYEGYVVDDVIAFMDSNYCTMGNEARYIMGSSMGGSGALDIALRHPEKFRCVCTTAAVPDMEVCLPYVIEEVLSECPETQPPYSYDWGNGFYTDAEFMYSGGYSPNLSAPDSIDFPLDEFGILLDSVYTRWELHNAAHMVKMNPPDDLMIGLTWGLNDPQAGLLESNFAFVDTLTDLGLPHTVYTDNGGHGYTITRLSEMMIIAMGWSGIQSGQSMGAAGMAVYPNPTTGRMNTAFRLSQETPVVLEVYDLCGRMVLCSRVGSMTSGCHHMELDLTGMCQGVYHVLLRTAGGACSSSMVLLD